MSPIFWAMQHGNLGCLRFDNSILPERVLGYSFFFFSSCDGEFETLNSLSESDHVCLYLQLQKDNILEVMNDSLLVHNSRAFWWPCLALCSEYKLMPFF